MSVIDVSHLTKDYGHGRGVFDITFHVDEGEVFGFLGPNGAGKTTTIRHIMGFSKPQTGTTSIQGQDSWQHYDQNQRQIGYLPGEIALPEALTGNQFIKMMAELRGIKDMSYTDSLIERFELDPTGGLKRMSLGMKRKLAIVTAFMHDPAILILDEPTSGLDPVMQDVFIQFIKDEKQRGKTILLSSHIFPEVDATADRIAIIKDGRIVSEVIADDLRHNQLKTFKVEFRTKEDFDACAKAVEESTVIKQVAVKHHRNQLQLQVDDTNINALFALLANFELNFMTEIKFTLEDHFMQYYDRSGDMEVTTHAID